MVFVVDDLGAWLVGLLADAILKKLTALVLGSDQERALRQAAKAAIERTAEQLAPSDGQQAQQLATAIGKVFRDPSPGAAVAGQPTLLEALQAGIAGKLAVLDDPRITGIGQSSAVPGGVLAEMLACHLVREIMVRGSGGGPLAPLADQLNHDVTHLQGQRLEGMLAQLAAQVTALAQVGGGAQARRKPVRLPPRPVSLAGREELLAEVGTRLRTGDDPEPRLVALCGLGGAGKTSVAAEYAHRQLAEVGVAWQFPAEDATALADGFGELAAQLGVRGPADNLESVASVHAVLAGFAAPWLLIFDNAADMATVTDFLPPAGSGRVLITSQTLSGRTARSCVCRCSAPRSPRTSWSGAPATRTGRQPQSSPQSSAGCRWRWSRPPRKHGPPGTLSLGTWLCSSTGGPSCWPGDSSPGTTRRWPAPGRWRSTACRPRRCVVGLLRLLAFLAPEAVPLRLLLQSRPGLAGRLNEEVAPVLVPLLEDRLAADDAIAALQLYSLLTPVGGGSVSVHRLVQAVTADRMPGELRDAWRQAAAAVIEAALPDDPRQPDTWPTFAALLPHAQAVLGADSDGLT